MSKPVKIGALFLTLVIAVWMAGRLFLPADYSTARRIWLRASCAQAWGEIFDPFRHQAWRPDLERVEQVDGRSRRTWKEYGPWGERTVEMLSSAPPRRMAVRTAGGGGEFTWVYEFTSTSGGCILTIREQGSHPSAFGRVWAAVAGDAGDIESAMLALARHFGDERSRPVAVE